MKNAAVHGKIRFMVVSANNKKRLPWRPDGGFTLIEVLTVLFLASMVALPFTRMFTFGMQGSVDNLEHINAYNLAREKLEEVKSLPFEAVRSDFDNFRDIYRENPDLMDYYGSKEKFETIFSDVVTSDRMKKENDKEKEICEKIMELYKKYFFRDYDIYPDEYTMFRRVMDVDDKYDSAVPPRLKKVTVKVFDRKGHRLAEIVTLVGKSK